MVELTIGSSSDFVDDSRFQINKNGARDVLAGTGLAEERVEGVIPTPDSFVGRHLSTIARQLEKPGKDAPKCVIFLT